MLTQPKIASVLFDESHSEAWTIRPELAAQMQPSHPADSSLAEAAATLASRDFEVAAHTGAPIDFETLAGTDVLVIAHPSDPKWEHTLDGGSPRLDGAEIEAIERFVRDGGGLIVLGETEQDKYGNNLNELLERFGVAVENATVQDYEHHREAPAWVMADLTRANGTAPDLLARVGEACFYRAGTVSLANGGRVIARTHETADPPGAPLAAVTEHGAGRVVVLADSDLFGDDCIGDLDHVPLWLNLVYWAAGAAFAKPTTEAHRGGEVVADPHWSALKDAVAELRLTQEPDGSVDLSKHDRARTAELTGAIATEVEALAPRFPQQAGYFAALASDLAAWGASDFGRPDFYASTDALHPERHREDGIEHLVVFPMYKQNASRDTCFEALLVRTPWPEFVAELESGGYDNAKFVPVELIDYTDGYDSECAVLFPETFSVHDRPPAHFGAIFCDREAERFRRVCGAAAEILHLNLPPDAACLLSSPQLSQNAYITWDLIHDRTHMHGDLPFDPFMIRQRSPFWMYSLEELRCDLTAFGEAVKLEREGFAFARYVQYAIIFDRLFRFPVTGSRVRNYDGLGGQLLFAYLHKEGYLDWTDNALRIDWDRVADGVTGLRERVQALYHSGIDRSKLSQWIAAHDLVSEYVPATEASVWDRGGRDLPEVDEPKQLVDLVRDDEFPLSLFYSQLKPKLEPALERRPIARNRPRREGLGQSEPSGSLAGRVIAVAGAGGGLGPVVCSHLAAAGATIAATDISQERLDAIPAEAGIPEERWDGRVVDLLDPEAAAGWSESLVERFGKVDGLVHLVGGWKGGQPLHEEPLEDWALLHDLLIRTVQHTTRGFHDALAAGDHGRFVLVSAKQAQHPSNDNAIYAAAKAAAEAWTLAYADGFEGTGTTANIVVVNAILTPQMREANPDKAYATFTPAEHLAEAIAFLCSDEGGRMNGQRLSLHP